MKDNDLITLREASAIFKHNRDLFYKNARNNRHFPVPVETIGTKKLFRLGDIKEIIDKNLFMKEKGLLNLRKEPNKMIRDFIVGKYSMIEQK